MTTSSCVDTYEEFEVEAFGYFDVTEDVRVKAQDTEEAMRPPRPLPYDPIEMERIRPHFAELSATWKRERQGGSTVRKMIQHPAYQEIVAMGKNAIPLVLGELEQEVDFWFNALEVLTGTNPVSERDMGSLSEMRNAWLWWGYTLEYCRAPRSYNGLPKSAEDWISKNQ